jgi:hypothetical protein
MIEDIQDGNQIISDGRTVWVNGADGCCLARFSKFGIDIHKDVEGQTGGEVCLDCGTVPDWDRFVLGCLGFHGIIVEDRHRPRFLGGRP